MSFGQDGLLPSSHLLHVPASLTPEPSPQLFMGILTLRHGQTTSFLSILSPGLNSCLYQLFSLTVGMKAAYGGAMWANGCTREQGTEHLTAFPRLLRALSCRIREQPKCECRNYNTEQRVACSSGSGQVKGTDELDLSWIFFFQQLGKPVVCIACSEMHVQQIWGCYGSAQKIWRCVSEVGMTAETDEDEKEAPLNSVLGQGPGRS